MFPITLGLLGLAMQVLASATPPPPVDFGLRCPGGGKIKCYDVEIGAKACLNKCHCETGSGELVCKGLTDLCDAGDVSAACKNNLIGPHCQCVAIPE